MDNEFSLDQHAEDFYDNGFEPNELALFSPEWNEEQNKNAADNLKFRLSNFYRQYEGTKGNGCILYWIYVYVGLQYAERCCGHENKVTLSPYSDSIIAKSYEWIEDSSGVFRPHFEFAPEFAWAAKEQEIYEKYVLNKE